MALGAWRLGARRARHGALDVKELAALLQDTSTPLDLNTMITGEVSEHSYVFYDVAVPTEVKMLKVVIIPSSGAPTSTSPTWRNLARPLPGALCRRPRPLPILRQPVPHRRKPHLPL